MHKIVTMISLVGVSVFSCYAIALANVQVNWCVYKYICVGTETMYYLA